MNGEKSIETKEISRRKELENKKRKLEKEIEEIEYQIEQIKKGDLDQITKDKIIKELENKKYILENKED